MSTTAPYERAARAVSARGTAARGTTAREIPAAGPASAPQDTTSHCTTTHANAPQDTTARGTITHANAPQGTITHANAPQGTTAHANAPQDTAAYDAAAGRPASHAADGRASQETDGTASHAPDDGTAPHETASTASHGTGDTAPHTATGAVPHAAAGSTGSHETAGATPHRAEDTAPHAGGAAPQRTGDARRPVLRVAPEAGATRAERIASEVVDPELPMLTLAELGVLRGVEVAGDGSVTATLTPTYSGCPAMAEMRASLAARLRAAGYADVRIETVLDPPWTTDWISDEGRRKLAEHGIAPPGPAPRRTEGPVLLDLSPTRRAVPCPRCGSADTEELSRFGATSCRALRRCRSCREPFEHVKEI